MITTHKLEILGVLLLSFLLAAAHEGAMVVKLTVKHDGQEKPAPDHITLSFDDHSLQIPVRDGKFEVPPEVVGAHKVAFAADLGDDHVRVTGISGEKFARESWTLLLAERAYVGDYQWVVPKDADI